MFSSLDIIITSDTMYDLLSLRRSSVTYHGKSWKTIIVIKPAGSADVGTDAGVDEIWIDRHVSRMHRCRKGRSGRRRYRSGCRSIAT